MQVKYLYLQVGKRFFSTMDEVDHFDISHQRYRLTLHAAITGFSSGSLGTILIGSIQVSILSISSGCMNNILKWLLTNFLLQVPITILGAILMDRSGRKPLIMVCEVDFISFSSWY